MSAPRRLACLLVPLFPLAARLRSEPSLQGEAVVIVEGNGGGARVLAASRGARKAGVRPGMTLAQGRALLPKLVPRARDRESEKAAQEALLEVAGSFSPAVEETGEGTLTLDLGPWSPANDERHRKLERDLGRDLIGAAKKAGLPAGVGIATPKLAARVAAALPDSPTVVPHGEEASFLAPLPLERLLAEAGPDFGIRRTSRPDLELLATLLRWGVRSAGDLARLPAAEVAARLGEPGRRLHARARGLDAEPLFPRLLAPVFTEGMELEWPLVTLEPFLALAQGALERLAARLASEGLGCARLELALRLEPEGHDLRAYPLPAPTRDVSALLRIVRVDLEKRLPGAAVAAFALTAVPDAPRRGQMSFFGPAEISPQKLATALATLLSLVGEGRVGSPTPLDGHRPERCAVGPWDPPPAPLLRGAQRDGRGLLGVRVLRPAVPLEVLVEDEPGVRPASRPTSLRSLAPHEGTPGTASLEIAGSVRVASGPWHLEEAWWSEEPVSRDYWDLELSSGGLYRVYHDVEKGEWFADGVYD